MKSELEDKLRVKSIEDDVPGGGVSVTAARRTQHFTGHIEEITFSCARRAQPMVGDIIHVEIAWDNYIPPNELNETMSSMANVDGD